MLGEQKQDMHTTCLSATPQRLMAPMFKDGRKTCIILALTAFPGSLERTRRARRRTPCWPVSGLVEAGSVAFPGFMSKPSGYRQKPRANRSRPLTVAGAAQVRFAVDSLTPLLPVELRRVNHSASTNAADSSADHFLKPYNQTLCRIHPKSTKLPTASIAC